MIMVHRRGFYARFLQSHERFARVHRVQLLDVNVLHVWYPCPHTAKRPGPAMSGTEAGIAGLRRRADRPTETQRNPMAISLKSGPTNAPSDPFGSPMPSGKQSKTLRAHGGSRLRSMSATPQ